MPGKLKRIVRARMKATGEAYTTALMRVRECDGKIAEVDAEKIAAATIAISPPRKGAE